MEKSQMIVGWEEVYVEGGPVERKFTAQWSTWYLE